PRPAPTWPSWGRTAAGGRGPSWCPTPTARDWSPGWKTSGRIWPASDCSPETNGSAWPMPRGDDRTEDLGRDPGRSPDLAPDRTRLEAMPREGPGKGPGSPQERPRAKAVGRGVPTAGRPAD